MLPPTLVPMKTTTMANCFPCHSLFLCWWNDNYYYAPTTWKTTMGRKALSPYLVASNEELEVGNLELQTLLVVVAIHCCCYQLLLLLKNKRKGEWKRGKIIKQKQNKGDPLLYKQGLFSKMFIFFSSTPCACFQGLLLQQRFLDFCSRSKYTNLIVVQVRKEWHKENNNTKQKLKPTPHNV